MKLYPRCHSRAANNPVESSSETEDMSLVQASTSFTSVYASHDPSISFKWPQRDDICWVPFTHTLTGIPAPDTGSQGCQYKINIKFLEDDNVKFENFRNEIIGLNQ